MRQVLDRVTGRVTMYRLVTLSLLVIAVAALLLSALGQLPYTAPEVAASLAVAVVSTVVVGRLFALVFRSRPHTESSVITALLLFLLFWPSLEPVDLGVLALAGALATASKYLIAWRGRHILNPAAAGATLVALLGFDSAVWWVATGALLPLVVVGAFLVLYRTRRLPLGLVFIVVASAILTARLTVGGQDVADAFSTSLVSYPVIFFAGFMLSEPLTLPPRRWQQLALAVIVAVLFTVPFSFGPIYLSFEFALVIGNVLAFLVGQRRGIRLSLVESTRLTPTAWRFAFQPAKPVDFRPGQYLELSLPHSRADTRGSRRMFSIASAPSPDGPISVALRTHERSSSFKRAVLELPPGATLTATSVGGDFLLPRDPAVPVLLVAGGIGITPFLSQLAHDRASGVDRDVVLVYAVGSLEELAFTDELRDETVLLVAPTAPAELPGAWRWIGAGPISRELLDREVADLRTRTAFVSGAPHTVTAVRRHLRSLGVRRVRTDYFSGY
ncbi:MAG: hypothetical protein RI885_247 [Actinomycetota bacterium]